MTRVALLDYGMGNLHSAAKALERVGATVDVTADPRRVAAADRVVFPGVGAMRDCMAGMQAAGVDNAVREVAFQKPLLAICVGMQSLMQRSEENGGVDCLSLFEGQVRRFEESPGVKVPHMGWNTVTQVNPAHPLWQGIDDQTYFYFVHSYYVQPSDKSIVAGWCDYGQQDAFAAALTQDNLFATQFHPEKSHTAGLKLLENFVNWRI